MLELNKIYCMDALSGLKKLDSESIDCVMTSPPYWALRDYGVDGQLGLEPTFQEYIGKLCDIFDEVKRVLKKTGTCWVNLGDSYNSNHEVGTTDGKKGWKHGAISTDYQGRGGDKSLPIKCLCQIPARFGIEMTNRGWILRNEIIWYKPNCMPASVKDRFTVDFEKIFFFVKNKKYWFEQQFDKGVMESAGSPQCNTKKTHGLGGGNTGINLAKARMKEELKEKGFVSRNKRTVWRICPKPFSEAHFAVFPEELCETPIKAGCPEFICKKCGKAREKVYERREYIGKEKEVSGKFKDSNVHSAGAREHYLSEQRKYEVNQKEIAIFIKNRIENKENILDDEFGDTTWRHWVRTDESGASLPSPEQYERLKEILSLPEKYDREMLTTVKILVDDKGNNDRFIDYSDCKCNAGWNRGIVLDPFAGSGTALKVAKHNGRNYLGFDISPEYIKIANRRIAQQTLWEIEENV